MQNDFIHTDVLVVGAGIAGLSFALKLSELNPDLKIDILCKDKPEQCSTAMAQGGIAVVIDTLKDSFEQHIDDTMRAGGYESERRVVETVVREAPLRLNDLFDWGIEFDRNSAGDLSLHREGGHSSSRIVHKKDHSGSEIETKLLARLNSFPNIRLHTERIAMDLIVSHTDHCNTESSSDFRLRCEGFRVYNKTRARIEPMYAMVCMLAGGGCGTVYASTTNPYPASGDAYAMAYRAGLKLRDMAYMQFHPTVLYEPGQTGSLYLITEALRGYGAFICNRQGKRFLFRYDGRGELAARDIVSAAIRAEMKETASDFVFIDCRHLNYKDLKLNFPSLCSALEQRGISAEYELIPIVPAAHYQCGGVPVDENSRTQLAGLFASGECASTGLHGRNRLASNSLLEALVYAHRAAMAVIEHMDCTYAGRHLSFGIQNTCSPDSETLKQTEVFKMNLRSAMDSSTNEPDQEAIRALYTMLNNIDAFVSGLLFDSVVDKEILGLRNMACTARMILSDMEAKRFYKRSQSRRSKQLQS